MLLGSHVSMSKGLVGAAKEAHSYGANTFMLYTGAPQNTKRKPIEELKVKEGFEYMKENNLDSFVVHAPYIINLASYKEHIFDLAVSFLEEEIKRTEAMGSKYLVLHPGAFTDKDMEYGINRIAEGLNMVLKEEQNVIVCLETMAGKGSEVGSKFEELKAIIDKVELKEKIAVCFDTCHTHDAGYNITTDFEGVLDEFDELLGLDLIKVLHINGSLNPQGAKKDRHANISATDENNERGKDYIGSEVIYSIVHNKRLEGKYFILETPWLDKKTNLYKVEIEMLRSEKAYDIKR
ncbi:MAG: deoxyribonuclease IV [Clostridia bacterium]|jgi:deoxyribonuclease-4|nr:deoxyribonuclease IV [Clostridia bacterium]